ncbi:phosphotransferase enzyme family protein [Aspergillus heteromorphus CBS 117.55]|uniref:Phosphotransferase enzyme family protein n=1 Tax=Aspergillus heteromorphus CBS 117.55 TaxID=1448321 RepID=A0A317WNA0_9EURO|nr:phosphotransferase enzyme family protein [Aspergillus heteromorphus CBS 117.55]PWY86722.1 phosphotransferase enzyme family protein [Aspergillus heteromorphus CBS 117.55]
MAPPPERVASIMLSWHTLDLVSCTTLQTLWAGYGQICAITARATTDAAAAHLSAVCGVESAATATATAGSTYPLILKLISPPRHKSSSREDEGHLRKMLSYEVEQYFYSDVVPRLGEEIAVAQCLASTRGMEGKDGEEELRGLMATVMVDLRPRFPVAGGKRSALDRVQVCGALEWLGRFHGRSWGLLGGEGGLGGYVLPPLEEVKRRKDRTGMECGNTLWLNGGYTYLATRRKEYASLVEDVDSEWSEAMCVVVERSGMSVAEMAALVLTPCGRPVESYIHGDVKSENLFTTEKGDEVAFFDFQYVGLGLGVCDLAKLFTCSVPIRMLVDDAHEPLPEALAMCDGERRLLERYRQSLLLGQETDRYEWDAFKRHWETALVDWCRFQASWGFWGNTEWLEARVRSILSDREWRDWLHRNVDSRK